ncbi:PH domain-containing protein [Micromonospora tulbaghiae]|uniref:PH domain-containing protein n=1 Tax=Micromonospora TaxID=1873 RepID=UPI00207CBD06|nr:PH domain-containing protein [Micromonospora sp. CPM1]MCO1615255.1 PH domain-containing protein [Micromonospora sp. CPM1]
MSRADTVRFRHNQAILVAAIVAFIGALPLASARWWLLWVLLVPLAVAVWAWRAGTDADARELRLRALVGQRRVPWNRVAELAGDARGRAVARLDDGEVVVLPAVRATDLPRLVAVTGQELSGTAGDQ